MKCPVCGSEETWVKGGVLRCWSCRAEVVVGGRLGLSQGDEAEGIMLDAQIVARYSVRTPPGVV